MTEKLPEKINGLRSGDNEPTPINVSPLLNQFSKMFVPETAKICGCGESYWGGDICPECERIAKEKKDKLEKEAKFKGSLRSNTFERLKGSKNALKGA